MDERADLVGEGVLQPVTPDGIVERIKVPLLGGADRLTVGPAFDALDGQETGYWDADQKKWVVDNSYAAAVSEARRVAKKDGPPNLLTVPVPAPKEVRA